MTNYSASLAVHHPSTSLPTVLSIAPLSIYSVILHRLVLDTLKPAEISQSAVEWGPATSRVVISNWFSLRAILDPSTKQEHQIRYAKIMYGSVHTSIANGKFSQSQNLLRRDSLRRFCSCSSPVGTPKWSRFIIFHTFKHPTERLAQHRWGFARERKKNSIFLWM